MYETISFNCRSGTNGINAGPGSGTPRNPVSFDRGRAKPFEGSRGKGMQPRTLEIFDDLGVIDAILAAGTPYPKFQTHLGPFSLRAGSLGSAKQPTESVPYPNIWMVPQARTEAILRERLWRSWRPCRIRQGAGDVHAK